MCKNIIHFVNYCSTNWSLWGISVFSDVIYSHFEFLIDVNVHWKYLKISFDQSQCWTYGWSFYVFRFEKSITNVRQTTVRYWYRIRSINGGDGRAKKTQEDIESTSILLLNGFRSNERLVTTYIVDWGLWSYNYRYIAPMDSTSHTFNNLLNIELFYDSLPL